VTLPQDGFLTLKQLTALVKSDEIDTVLVGFPDLYGRLMGKRFDATFFLDTARSKGTHCCDYLLTVDMEMTPIAGYELANWESGYGDFHMVPNLSSLRVASWLEKTALVICDLQNGETAAPIDESPRAILTRQVAAASKAGFDALGASELEYYMFEDSYREAYTQHYDGLQPTGWYLEDYDALQGTRVERFNQPARRHLARSGVPVETSKGEWGLGQHELNIRYANVLEMADRHIIFKQCLKEIADSLGMSVSFMAKYAKDQAGSSCHVHLSLRADGGTAFTGDQTLGPIRCSNIFKWFLGGWIAHVPDVMVFYAPNVNSYRRYQEKSWAPTRLAWSHDNRTAGFRVVGSGESLRIECRLPGADCNPYLVFAGSLASGLDGVANKIEPPPHFSGDLYAATEQPSVPSSLEEATELFETSPFARSVFGDRVVQHYAHFFKTEASSYDVSVGNWERKRYFERI